MTSSAGTVTRNYTYDGRNQLRQIDDSQADTITLSYDNQGNLVQKQVGQDLLAYSWNARDHLIQVSRNGSVLGRYSTDAEGLRVSKEALDPLQSQAPPPDQLHPVGRAQASACGRRRNPRLDR